MEPLPFVARPRILPIPEIPPLPPERRPGLIRFPQFSQLPAEIRRNYFYNRPELYSGLANTSRANYEFSRNPQTITALCNRSVSIEEIEDAFFRPREGYGSLRSRYIQFYSIGRAPETFFSYHTLYETDVNFEFILRDVYFNVEDSTIIRETRTTEYEFASVALAELKRRDLKLVPIDLYRILSHRRLCVLNIPNYAVNSAVNRAREIFDELLELTRDNPHLENINYPILDFIGQFEDQGIRTGGPLIITEGEEETEEQKRERERREAQLFNLPFTEIGPQLEREINNILRQLPYALINPR